MKRAIGAALLAFGLLALLSGVGVAYYCILTPQSEWFHGADGLGAANLLVGVVVGFIGWTVLDEW